MLNDDLWRWPFTCQKGAARRSLDDDPRRRSFASQEGVARRVLDDDPRRRLSASQEGTARRVLDDNPRGRLSTRHKDAIIWCVLDHDSWGWSFACHVGIAWHMLDDSNNKKYHSNSTHQSAKPDQVVRLNMCCFHVFLSFHFGL